MQEQRMRTLTLVQVAKSLKVIRDLWVSHLILRLQQGLVRTESDGALRRTFVLSQQDIIAMEKERDTPFEELEALAVAVLTYQADVFLQALADNSQPYTPELKEAESTPEEFVLVEYAADWADEYDVGGYAIDEQGKWVVKHDIPIFTEDRYFIEKHLEVQNATNTNAS